MLVYPILKIFVRIAIRIFCSEIIINKRGEFNKRGPLLLIANHPNSFFDAVVIGALFKHPVHFLARGDAFKKPWHNTLLKLLNMIPIYRLSEGKENLHLNAATFERSKQILAENGIVLIFIEGLCLHEYGLRPFKKGAARIAMNCMNENIPLNILPIGLNYSTFTEFGMHIELNAGKPIPVKEIFTETDEAKNFLTFNAAMQQSLEPLVWNENRTKETSLNPFQKLLALPGKLLNAVYYLPIKNFVRNKTKGTIFYHAILFGILLFTYPLYVSVVCLALILAGINKLIALSTFVVFPLLAYIAVQQRK